MRRASGSTPLGNREGEPFRPKPGDVSVRATSRSLAGGMVALRTRAQALTHLRSAGDGFSVMRRLLLVLTLAAAAPPCRPADTPPAAARGAVTVKDDAGRSVALDGPAQRIVSLLPSFTEILFAIGAGDRLVGRTTWCDYPPAARDVPSVGDGMPPNVEAVAARRPGLVVLYRSGPNVTAATQLERLGIRTVLLDLNLLEDLGPATRRLGALTGRVAAADSLAAAMDSLASAPPHAPLPTP